MAQGKARTSPISKSEIGLSNVDNTSDANKPVSTAQGIAIDAKVADSITDGVTTIAPSQNAVFDALATKQDTITPSALTKVDDTNVTITLGGTPTTALLQTTSLTLGWTGTLADSRIASATTWNAKVSSLYTKSGVILGSSFAGNPKKRTITFSTPFADADYSVSIVGNVSRAWSIETELAGSFVVNANANTVLTGNVYWVATKHGEN